MPKRIQSGIAFLFSFALFGATLPVFAQSEHRAHLKDATSKTAPTVIGNKITLADGYSFEADDVWKDGDEIWYRRGTISQRLTKPVASLTPLVQTTESPAPVKAASTRDSPAISPQIWIYLADGARFRVDQVIETATGVWYDRGRLTMFMDRERIARVERELPGAKPPSSNRDWSSGNAYFDQLIKANSARFGLDPYLVFLVIEQESRFRTRAVSPKGAQGLMQLMPGTARRFGVRRPFNPAENIRGGTQYLKELMKMFNGRIDLVLASYNAGEGAVVKFGRKVPPYKETRNYVKKISKRYGRQR